MNTNSGGDKAVLSLIDLLTSALKAAHVAMPSSVQRVLVNNITNALSIIRQRDTESLNDLLSDMRRQVSCATEATMPIPLYERMKAEIIRQHDADMYTKSPVSIHHEGECIQTIASKVWKTYADHILTHDIDEMNGIMAMEYALKAHGLLKQEEGLADPDMPEQQLRLHFGELTAQGVKDVRAAIRFANGYRARQTQGEYSLHRDRHGFIDGIDRDGYTVLQLIAGTERNEQEAAGIVDLLNSHASGDKATLSMIDETAFEGTFRENLFYKKDLDKEWLRNFVSYYESEKASLRRCEIPDNEPEALTVYQLIKRLGAFPDNYTVHINMFGRAVCGITDAEDIGGDYCGQVFLMYFDHDPEVNTEWKQPPKEVSK